MHPLRDCDIDHAAPLTRSVNLSKWIIDRPLQIIQFWSIIQSCAELHTSLPQKFNKTLLHAQAAGRREQAPHC